MHNQETEQNLCIILKDHIQKSEFILKGVLKMYHTLLDAKQAYNKEQKLKNNDVAISSKVNKELLAIIKDYMEKRMPSLKSVGNLQTRDEQEIVQIFHDKPLPLSELDTKIHSYLQMKSFTMCYTAEDFQNEIIRNKKGLDLLEIYGEELTIKELLEILRRAGIVVNNNAPGTVPGESYPEGQGHKLVEKAYTTITLINKNKTISREVLSQKLLDYLTTQITIKNYKIQISIDNPDNAVILDRLRLHPNITIDDPIDENYIYIIGNLTNSKGPDVFRVSKKQKYYPISETKDTSKKPQFIETETIKHIIEDPVDKKQNVRFGKNVIRAFKKDFLENTVATEDMLFGKNEINQVISELLTSHLQKFIDNMRGKTIEEPLVLDKKGLLELGIQFFIDNINDAIISETRHKEELDKLSEKQRGIKILKQEEARKKATLKEKEVLYYRELSRMRPHWKWIIKIRELLESQDKAYEHQENEKQRLVEIEAKKEKYSSKKAFQKGNNDV